MAYEMRNYRQVAVGKTVPGAVVVTITAKASGMPSATVSGAPGAAVGADDVPVALNAAERLRAENGLNEVVIVLGEGVTWQAEWGQLNEALTDAEGFALAAGIEAENDA